MPWQGQRGSDRWRVGGGIESASQAGDSEYTEEVLEPSDARDTAESATKCNSIITVAPVWICGSDRRQIVWNDVDPKVRTNRHRAQRGVEDDLRDAIRCGYDGARYTLVSEDRNSRYSKYFARGGRCKSAVVARLLQDRGTESRVIAWKDRVGVDARCRVQQTRVATAEKRARQDLMGWSRCMGCWTVSSQLGGTRAPARKDGRAIVSIVDFRMWRASDLPL